MFKLVFILYNKLSKAFNITSYLQLSFVNTW